MTEQEPRPVTTLSTTPSDTLTLLAETAEGTGGTGGPFIAVLVAVVAVICLVLFLGALVGILRSRNLTLGGKLLWVIAIFVFQFFGPLVWFLWGRNSQLSRTPSYHH